MRGIGVPKTADIIAGALYEEGVRYAYGIPGGEVLELLEAFRKDFAAAHTTPEGAIELAHLRPIVDVFGEGAALPN